MTSTATHTSFERPRLTSSDIERLISQWRILSGITSRTERSTEATLSARLRDFRKECYGDHLVLQRRRVSEISQALYEYPLVQRANTDGGLS